jgi:hypothetical protein
MRNNKLWFAQSKVLIGIAVILTLVSSSWATPKERVIHHFPVPKGSRPLRRIDLRRAGQSLWHDGSRRDSRTRHRL